MKKNIRTQEEKDIINFFIGGAIAAVSLFGLSYINSLLQ